MFDALETAALQMEHADRAAMLIEEGDKLAQQARLELAGPDLAEVEERYALFRKALR